MQKAIKLSEHIRYLTLEDEEGVIGVMWIEPHGSGSHSVPYRVVSIHDRADFKFYFNELRLKEDKQYLWRCFDAASVGSSESLDGKT